MNTVALALFAEGCGVDEDNLIALASVRALERSGWRLFDPTSPDPDELAQTILRCAEQHGVHPHRWIDAAITDLMCYSDDAEAELIRSHPPSRAIY